MIHAVLARKAASASKSEITSATPGGLRVGKPDDALEQEAERAADRVMEPGRTMQGWSLSRMNIEPPVQRKCACGGSGECEECKGKEDALQRRAAGTEAPSPSLSKAPPIVHDVLRSPGQPLDRQTRTFMERRFAHDFSRVRVHTDAKAAKSAGAVNALAYTVGQHIAFASGRYAPATLQGRRLIAHELAHTIQQGDGVSPERGGLLARQGASAGQAAPVAPPVAETEDPFKTTGLSQEYGRKSSWGWGAPETNNVYQECKIAPLKRDKFKAFVNSLPREPRGRKKPPNAEEVLGITSFNPGNAKAPEINPVTVQDNGKTVYKLKPTHAEMPPIRSAYTDQDDYVEGFFQDITEECKSQRIRLGTSKFPIHWEMTGDGAKKTMEAEQEHCNDIRAAFDLTLGLYASAINNLAASERTYSKPEQVTKEGVRAAGVNPDDMIYNFADMAAKTRLRDDSEWHTAQPIGDPARKDRPRKSGCEYFYKIDTASWPDVGPHKSSEVMEMTKAAKAGKPGKP